MLKLFNRLAWLVSIALASIFVIFLLSWMGGRYYRMGDDTFVFVIIASVAAMIFKRVFISYNFISSSLKIESKDTINLEKKVEEPATFDSESTPLTVAKSEVFSDKIKASLDVLTPDYPVDDIASAPEIPLASFSKKMETVTDDIVVKEEAKKELEETKEESGPNFIQRFFAENALAKVGGIFLFLAVLFLLQAVYNYIGPIEKLMIGFAIGFAVFGAGLFVDHRGYHKESKILFGSAILINYLVILSGRYLIGEEMVTGTILGETITFALLVANTIFAVTVSMANKSYVLLFFSFVVAYLNPFLIGAKDTTTPYTLLAYSIAVSLGAIFLSYFYRQRASTYSSNLLNTAFLGGNILILLAPFETNVAWLLKLITFILLSLLLIVMAYKNKQVRSIGSYFIGIYIFLTLMIFYGSGTLSVDLAGFNTIAYLIFMAFLLVSASLMFSLLRTTSLIYSMFAPLIILPLVMYNGVLGSDGLPFVIIALLLLYFALFVKLLPVLKSSFSYSFFGAIGLLLLYVSNFTAFRFLHEASVKPGFNQSFNFQFYGTIVSVFIFLLFSYYFSSKKKLEYLYSIGTIFSIFMILPIVFRSGDFRIISEISIIALMFFNILAPFINHNLLYAKIRNLIIGLVSATIFASYEIFYFWYGDVGQSKMTLGLLFMVLAVLYFFVASAMNFMISTYVRQREVDASVSKTNIVYALLGISISLFSLAVAYIFSTHSEVVSIVWLFEASVLFYFYKRTSDLKIYTSAVVLMLVGLVKMTIILDVLGNRDYVSFIPIFIMFLSLVAGLKFLEFEKRNLRLSHDILHVAGIVLTIFMVMAIVPSHYLGWLSLALSVIAILLAFAYGTMSSVNISIFFLVFVSLSYLYQVFTLDSVFLSLTNRNLVYLKIFQYISTALFVLSFFIFKYLRKQISRTGIIVKNDLSMAVVLCSYLFIIISQYVYYFFNENIFSLTIYWGLLSFVFLNFGIQRELARFRTLGLYILSLTTIKILLYDIWLGLDDAIMRVVALMLVGVVMIVVSILYSKKYEGRLSGEFNLDNLIK